MITFTDRYMFVDVNHNEDCGTAEVYSRRTGELVVSLPQQLSDWDRPAFVFELKEQDETEGIRPIAITPLDRNSEAYLNAIDEFQSACEVLQ